MLHIKAVKMNLDQSWGGITAVIQVNYEEQKGGALVSGLSVLRTKTEFGGGECNNYTKIEMYFKILDIFKED